MIKVQKILVLVLLLVLCLAGYMNSYVLFKPVYREGDALVVSSAPGDDTFYQNLELVLEHYNVPYKKSEDNRILVPRRLWRDRDTMWNYTTKANFYVPHEPGVADLWRDLPPAGELVEVDAYFGGATGYPMHGGGPPLPGEVACPMMWTSALTDQPFLNALKLLNSVRGNTLPDDAPWLIATIPEATEPEQPIEPNFPYHARFRGRLGEPAFAHCEQAERIFVVEEVVRTYEREAKEPPVYQLELPAGYENWPRYHDAALGYSVPYPPDWTVESLSSAELLGAVALRAPQWADYPIIVRVHERKITYEQYEPSQGHGWATFEQGGTFEAIQTQQLSGHLVLVKPAAKGKVAVLFSAHGRTYELALEYPIGFEASQSLLTHFSAIVEGFQLDVPPTTMNFHENSEHSVVVKHMVQKNTPLNPLSRGEFWPRLPS